MFFNVTWVRYNLNIYNLSDEKQLIEDGMIQPGMASGVIGKPINFNEVSLQNVDKYSIDNSDRPAKVEDTTPDYIDWGTGAKTSGNFKEYPDYGQPKEEIQPRENIDVFLPPDVKEEIIIEEIQLNPETGDEVIITEVLEETIPHEHVHIQEHHEHPQEHKPHAHSKKV